MWADRRRCTVGRSAASCRRWPICCGGFCNLNFWLLEWCVTDGPASSRQPFLGPRSGRLVAVGILRRTGAAGRFSSPPAAAPLVRGAVGRRGSRSASPPPHGRTITIGSIAPFSAWATAARCCWNFPPARRCSTTPARWARRRRAARADFRVPLVARHYASRRRGPLPCRHRPLQRPAGTCWRSFRVGAVYVSPVMFEKENQAVAALRDAIDRHGVPIREVRAGDRLCGGDGCVLEVLHPPRQRRRSAPTTPIASCWRWSISAGESC